MIDLFRPYLNVEGVHRRVCEVLSYDANGRAYIGEGPLVKEFERQFAALVGADPATVVAVNSCSSALALALQLAGAEHWRGGQEVISTPMTCTATNEAIVNAGAKIVWADIDPRTGLIDPADVARKLTQYTLAIMAVDWGGHACDYRALREVQQYSYRRYGVAPLIIEDAAHALLTTDRYGVGVAARHWHHPEAGVEGFAAGGDYVCYSLGPIKHLTAGHGGMLIAHRGDAARARKLRWHSLDRESSADFRCAQTIDEPGHLWHMADINAAIGLANLPHAEWVVARHRANAAFYDRALANLHGVTSPPPDEGSSYWCYFIQTDDRDGFIAFMKDRGVACSPVHAPNHHHPAYHFPNGPLPGVDHYAARNVAIPVGWWCGEEERQHVASAVTEWACFREGWRAA